MNNISQEPIIKVNHLAKHYGKKIAVEDLSLNINKGTIFGFLGPNGSGKTTSLRLLCGLITPDSGDGSCLGLDLFFETRKIQFQIGYMPQSFCLYRHLTVYENLDFIARIYSIENRKKRLKEILDLFSLAPLKDQITLTLSGGWQQRVSLAAALLHSPKILMLDEPTSGIDPKTRLIIWDHIQRLTEKGTTVLLSTHHLDEAERCHQLAYMVDGNILLQGSVDQMIHSSGLHTWSIKGSRLTELKNKLQVYSDFLLVIEKGFEVRVSSLDKDVIKKIDAEFLNNYQIESIKTSLEDVFVFNIETK